MTTEAIENIYALSPMQRGMLFHTLYAPRSGVYIDQLVCRIESGLDMELFHQAWQRVILRHPPLRTSFLWEGMDEPVQVVYRSIDLPWQEYDWHDLPVSQRDACLERMITEDRAQGFDVSQAPLMRCIFYHLSDGSYYFIWTRHHILLDSWSTSAIVQEVSTAYAALRDGQEPVLEPRRPFQEYISWLRQQNTENAETFWRAYLQGFTTPTSLPMPDYSKDQAVPSSGAGTSQGDILAQGRLQGGRPVQLRGLTVAPENVAAWRAFAGRYQLTLNTLLQGAWALILSRYSGECDVVFGATVAGRPTELVGSEKMVGLFINTLPVRVRVPPHEELLSWLARLQEQQVEARQYEYSPLVQVQGWSEMPRDRSLFESLVVFENYPLEKASDAEQGDSMRISAAQSLGQTNYPLVLIISATRAASNALKLQLGYETTRFSTSIIEHLLEQLHTILNEMTQHPTNRLGNISLLTEEEQHFLLSKWYGNQEPRNTDATVMDIFQKQARSMPEKVALVCGDNSLTYEELERRANQLASYLRQQGIGREDCVGVCMERSCELAIALLGVMKAGGVYLPLDPGSPAQRLDFMLSEASVSLVLTRTTHLKLFAASAMRTFCLEAGQGLPVDNNIDLLAAEFHPANAAYVIYTSGSTGRPKGVVISHQALLNHMQAMSATYNLQARDRILQFASMNFDVSLEELFPAWALGASVIMWAEALVPDPAQFSAFVAREGLSVLNIPSSYWHEWVGELARPGALLPPSLRLVVIGSEKASSARLVLWQRVVGERVMLAHAYGLTETTITTLVYQPSLVQGWEKTRPLPIGQPLANIQAYLLDERLQPVPIGVPGELYIGGECLARGYLRNASLTAERFLPHPYSDIPGTRIYRTGDRARYLPDGHFELLGRRDGQVKLRGFRIEPAEIEARLLQHPIVREALVVAREDSPGLPMLVAYIVVNEQASAFLEQLRQHLQESLPPYMIPSFFVPLETLPRTSTGKVDLSMLPAPHQRLVQLDAYIAPRTPMEEILAAIWSEVLRMERVGRFDHFFKLGGHSLQATQVVARLREILQIELPVRAIYDAPTIASLATRIEQRRQPASGLSIQALTREERAKQLPLSFAQQRLWFLDRFQPGSAFYTLPNMLYLRGSLDVAALKQSLQDLVQRHEILRTTFIVNAGQPMQVIAPQMHLALPVVQLLGTESMDGREEMVDALARDEAQRPFDLERGPLVRALLLRLNPREHVFLLTLHHIIADGWSIEILLREFSAFYASYVQSQPIRLPELPFQYADYAVWQRAWLQGAVLEQQLAYWQHQLQNAPAMLELPTDRPRPPVQTYKGARYAFQLPLSLSQRLQILSREEGVTLFMTLLAAFQTLLFRYSQQTDIVVGTPISGRVRREIEDTMGLFLNMLALRTQLHADLTYRDLLYHVRDVALDAYMHQDLPFEKLVEEVHPERSLSHTPLFQVMFVLQNTPGHAVDLPGLSLQTFGGESGTAKFDLVLGMRETAQGLRCSMEYSTDLFDRDTVARMMGHFQTLLEGCVANPACRLADLPLLTPPERQQLLISWNPAQALFSLKCIHHIIEHWAHKTPDALALVDDGQQITYAVLNHRANRLAHYLQRLGVGPESLVGLLMTRSLDAIISILGILKAGGAYVPLDPDAPQERLALLLKETACAGLLTQHNLSVRLPALAVPFILCLDTTEDIAAYPDSNPTSTVQPENLAYVIYTSGSTGQPKGVMVTHGSACHLAASQVPIFGNTTDIRASQWISLSFDASLSEILTTFQAGATLCLAAHDRLQSGAELLAFLRREAITNLSLPVSMLALLPKAELPCLRTIAVGAESLPDELVERWAPGYHLLNAYGPTETTVCATVAECVAGQPPTIGHPLSHVQVYILDHSLQPLPVGIPGELYIGGLGVARGYLRDPVLTAELFLPHPFSTIPGMRLYRTRDLVRYRPDGSIEFLGRVDSQVKVRGYRVEPGEIEAVLASHPAVCNAAVNVQKDSQEVSHLVAYAMPTEQAHTLSPQELRTYLQERLPDYMVPTHVLLLKEFPLSSNGKIDRRALPPLDWQREPDAEHIFVAPRNVVEQKLADIWAEVLGLELIGIHDNFFALGGDSIQTIQISARAQQAHLYLTPRQIFQWQTIAELAAVVNLTPVAVAEQGTVTGTAALTPVQYWFFEQDLPAPDHYNQALLLESSETLDAALWEQALAALLRQHDALRLCFSHIGTGWQQRFGSLEEVGSPRLLHIDYASLSLQEQDEAIQTVSADLHASLCLERGQLLCSGLFEAGPTRRQRLLLIIHHLVVDGISWNILLEDLTTAYRQLRGGEPVCLPAKTTSFQYWSSCLTEYARSDKLQQEAAYWLAMQQKSTQPLPRDFSKGREANTEGSLERIVITFGVEETQALVQDLPKVFRTQINDALLTALVYAFQPWTGTARLLIDLEGHGREPVMENVDLSRTVGWFTTLYPVLLDLESSQDMRQALQMIKEQLRSIPHHGIGYGVLRYLSGTEEIAAQLRALPQAEISFNYLGQAERSQEETGMFRPARVSTGPGFDLRGKRHYLLEIVGSINSGQLTLTWLYSKHVHERVTIEGLAQRYQESMRALLAQRQLPEALTPTDFPLARLDTKALNKISRLLERER